MNQSIINYLGNKYNETKQHINQLDINKYDTIIEPFCGSFGFSRYVNKHYPNTERKYIFYDNSPELIDFLNHIKELVENDTINLFMEDYNNIIDDINGEYDFKYEGRRYLRKPLVKSYIDLIDCNKHIKYMLKLNVLNGAFCQPSHKQRIDFDIYKQSTFINQSVNKLDLNVLNDKTLIYLDPPYIQTYCKTYDERDGNIYDSIYDIFNSKSDVFMVYVFHPLVDSFYKPFKKEEYEKIYQTIKKIVKHIIYSNFIFKSRSDTHLLHHH